MYKHKKEEMYLRIRQHGEALIRIFGLPETTDPVKLSNKLRTLDLRGHRHAKDYCNWKIDKTEFDLLSNRVLLSAHKLLGYKYKIIFNDDPRGYTLKIKDVRDNSMNIFRDCCGDVIIAPDFGL